MYIDTSNVQSLKEKLLCAQLMILHRYSYGR